MSYLDNPTIRNRLWARVQKTDTCWLWTGATSKAGYGQIGYSHNGKVYTHRLAYELTNGPIPDGLYVCHTCDVPQCVNPSHLFLGSQSDNMRDASSKQRCNPRRRLTEQTVREIVARYVAGELTSDLAPEYGLRQQNLKRLISGERWAHLWTAEEIARHRALLKQRRGYDVWRSRRR